MPHSPSGGGSMAPPISPCPPLSTSMKDLRSRARAIARRRSGLSNGAAFRLQCGRAVGDDRPFDTVEIGAVWLPIIPIAGHSDRLVLLVRDEFERAGADRM